MIYLPLLLVNELNFRVKDLMVSRYSTHFEYAGFFSEVNSHCVIYTFEENQQRHRSAAPDCVLRGNLFKDVQVLGASA